MECPNCGVDNSNRNGLCDECNVKLKQKRIDTDNANEEKYIKILDHIEILNHRVDQIKENSYKIGRTSIIDINMPFTSMIGFMIKWAIASIPAFIILTILGFFFMSIFSAIVG